MTEDKPQCGARNGSYSCQRDEGHDSDPRKNQPSHAAIVVSGNRPKAFRWRGDREWWTKVHV